MRLRRGFTPLDLKGFCQKSRVGGEFPKNEKFPFRGKNLTGFTLIELLIVIAVVAVLATITLLVLNPSEMLRKARDSKRISDLRTINDALGLAVAQVPPLFIGTSTYVYTSLPDSDPACGSYNLPSLSGTGFTYSCQPESTYRRTDGTGWIPANFDGLPSKVLSVLPVDPINSNNASSGLYYTYKTGSWELDAKMESSKYGPGGTNDVNANDGGDTGLLFEVGDNLAEIPAVINDRTGASSTPLDTTPPTVMITSPTGGANVSGAITIAASASDDVGVAGVQFRVDGANLGAEDTTFPYTASWDTTGYSNAGHNLTALARDTSSNFTTSSLVNVTVNNSVPVTFQATTTCMNTTTTGQNFELYNRLRIPGTGPVTITKLWYWQPDQSLSAAESIQMAIYNGSATGTGSPMFAGSSVVLSGTGDGSGSNIPAGWISANLSTPAPINLGQVYIFGVGPSVGTYNVARDYSPFCTDPSDLGSYYIMPASGGLDSSVPSNANIATTIIGNIIGVTYQ